MTLLNKTDIEQFIKFGKIGNELIRKEISQYLSDKLSGKLNAAKPQLKEAMPYVNALEKVLNNKALQEVSGKHPIIAEEMLAELLQWTKKTYQKIEREHPHEEEQQLFNESKEQQPSDFIRHFGNIEGRMQQKKYYTPQEFDLSFYKTKIETIPNTALNKQQSAIESLSQHFLSAWEEKLLDKILKYELEKIDQERTVFCEELYKKIEEFKKLKELLAPFTGELGRLWDLSDGVWSKTGFDVLIKYASILKKDKALNELAQVLGRFKRAEQEFEEEVFEKIVIKNNWEIDFAQKSELTGITESNDINHLLPIETVLLSSATTESIFLKKFAEKKLQTFEFQNRFLSTQEEKKEEKQKKEKETEKGPMIICIDTSGSMHGTPEYVAKVLCFAILKIALEDKRSCFLISFSTKIETLNLVDLPNSLDKIVEFLSMSFHGGTDAIPAIKYAIQLLATKEYKKADVLMVSDFIMPALDEDTSNMLENAKDNQTVFHSLTISNNSNNKILNQFNHNWIYNTENPNAMIELVKNIKSISKK